MKIQLLAPVSGIVIPLENVPDPAFAQGLLGPGIAIEPTGSQILSPAAGTVSFVHPNRHALTISLENSIQVLIHVGVDTVHLKGEGFEAHVRKGDQVHTGQKLLSFDPDLVAGKARSLMTLMIVTEPAGSKISILTHAPVVGGKTALVEVPSNKASTSARLTTDGDFAPPTNKESTPLSQAKSEILRIELKSGLHARPCGALATEAKKFISQIRVLRANSSSRKFANAKSLTSLLEMSIQFGEEIYFLAEGEDATVAVATLHKFLENFREDEPQSSTDAPEELRIGTIRDILSLNASSQSEALKPGQGISLSKGLAIGRLVQIQRETFQIDELSKNSSPVELQKLRDAQEQARLELESLTLKSNIFQAHQEILFDPEIAEACEAFIRQGKSAAFAWNICLSEHAARLSQSSTPLLVERASDLRDVRDRVLKILAPPSQITKLPEYEQMILVSEHLTPSDTMRFDTNKVVGFCTSTGGVTSHVAILAASMGVPAVGALDFELLKIQDGDEYVIDGTLGLLRKLESEKERKDILQAQKNKLSLRQTNVLESHKRAVTCDGHHLEIHANIGSLEEARKAVEMGADGIGLLRTEFLFQDRNTAPSEEEQLKVYQDIADVLEGRPLVLRTLDVGADKPLPYLKFPKEENPFLGIRGIRIGLRQPELLREQLRAILRVKSKGPLHVMFPMISTLEEFQLARKILEEERTKLNAPKISVGIMMEVPSVALVADSFAREVDFFSVGTNDLTQYTLAMDRGNSELAKQTDGLHPSVLKLIQLTVKAAHAHGKWVGICGGIASDPNAVAILMGLGVNELSAGVMALPEIKAQVRKITYKQAQDLASETLFLSTASEVRSLAQTETQGAEL